MSKNINFTDFTAEISTYDDGIFKVNIPDGKIHTKSDAILSLKEVSEDICGFSLKADTCENRLWLSDSEGAAVFATCENFYRRKDKGFLLEFRLSDNEKIFGLGEDNDVAFGRLDRRGTIRDMITGQRINQNHLTADFPIPFILSTGNGKPYGIYIDNTSNLTVDIGKTTFDKMTVNAPAGACGFYIITGERISEIVCKFSKITGRAKLPPLWVLGYMQSKCSFWDWEEIDDAVLTFKEKNIPLDCVVFDFDWAEYFNNYKWAQRWEGKSPEKIKFYNEAYGVHFMASNSGPMLKRNSDTFDDAVKNGVLAVDTKGNFVTCGHYSGELIDFTKPETEDWMYPQLERIMQDGIEAWWLDLTEPEGDAENTVYFAGERAEAHNIFSNSVSRVYHNAMKKFAPEKRSFVLTRTGTAGIQRNPTALWTGDIYSEYGTLQAHIPEALNTQLSGIPMWTCDTGGFLSPTNNENCPYNLYHNDRTEHALLYERWVQFSCFTPILRAHHAGGEAVPFRYNESVFEGMCRYIKLRYRLIPYIYSLYYENHFEGTPIMRPLFWHYENDEKAFEITDEYLFGENMLVAPVLQPNVTSRKVYFPEGKWYDFDYGYVYEGGKEYEVYAPQNRIPVFVKEGGIITMANISGETHSTREIDFSKLEAEIFPRGKSFAKIYTDDGETDAYLSGELTQSEITVCESEEKIVISVRADNDKFPIKELTAHIHMNKLPIGVKLNGEEVYYLNRNTTVRRNDASCRYFDGFNRILNVKMLLDSGENVLEITLDGQSKFEDYEPFCEEKLMGQLPYIYPPASLPCEIQAIHYDRGGESVAFHKIGSCENGAYRDDNAGIVQDEKGCYISGLRETEWLEYSVSNGKEGSFEIVLDGDLKNAEINVSIASQVIRITDGKAAIKLGTGQMVLRIEVLKGTCNLHNIIIRES